MVKKKTDFLRDAKTGGACTATRTRCRPRSPRRFYLPRGRRVFLTIAEIRERRGKPRGSDGVGGGGGGSSSGIAGSPMTLQLDEDDTISDLADSDAEVRGRGGPNFVPSYAVMWHASGSGSFSWVTFAGEIIRRITS